MPLQNTMPINVAGPGELASVRLSDEARTLSAGSKEPAGFLEKLIEHELFDDAFDFITQWFPKRHLVWWGCLCCWQALRPRPANEAAQALHAALSWVMTPSEENRRRAERAGYAADIATPAGNLALAAYLSSGSLAPPGQPEVVPEPMMASKAVANTVRLLLTRIAPDGKKAVQAQFVQLGIDIIHDKLVWTRTASEANPPHKPLLDEADDEAEEPESDSLL